MTIAYAPLKSDLPKKPPNKVLKWIFRIIMVFVVLFILFLVAMNAINGTGDAQRSSIENILGDLFKGEAHIEQFNRFSGIPFVSLEMENAIVTDPKKAGRLMMSVDEFGFDTGFINVMLKRPVINRIHVKNLYAAPGTILPKALIIDHIITLPESSEIEIKGQYSQLPFTLRAEVAPKNEGTSIARGFTLNKAQSVELDMDTIKITAPLERERDGLHFKGLEVVQSDKVILSGDLRLAMSNGLHVVGDLKSDDVNIHADLTYDSGVSGLARIKNYDLAKDGRELIDALKTVLQKINASNDGLYSDMAPDTGKALGKLPDIAVDLKIELRDVELNTAVMGDVDFPIQLQDAALSMKPISGQLSGGNLRGHVSYSEKDTPSYDHKFSLEGWDFGQLLTDMGYNHSEIKGRASVRSKIQTDHNIEGSLTEQLVGDFRFIASQGSMKSGVLDRLMSGLVTALMPDLGADKTSQINCVIADLDVKDGKANVKSLFADTERLTLVGEGDINLINKQYDLKLNPEPKNITLLDVTPSVNIGGPLNAPKVSPNTLSLAKKVGGAVLGVVNPVFLAASLTDFNFSDEHPCKKFVEIKE